MLTNILVGALGGLGVIVALYGVGLLLMSWVRVHGSVSLWFGILVSLLGAAVLAFSLWALFRGPVAGVLVLLGAASVGAYRWHQRVQATDVLLDDALDSSRVGELAVLGVEAAREGGEEGQRPSAASVAALLSHELSPGQQERAPRESDR